MLRVLLATPSHCLFFLACLFLVCGDAPAGGDAPVAGGDAPTSADACDAPVAGDARDAPVAGDARDAPVPGDAGTQVLPVDKIGGLGGEATNSSSSSIPATAAEKMPLLQDLLVPYLLVLPFFMSSSFLRTSPFLREAFSFTLLACLFPGIQNSSETDIP